MLDLPEEDLLEEAKIAGQLECLAPVEEQKARSLRFQYEGTQNQILAFGSRLPQDLAEPIRRVLR